MANWIDIPENWDDYWKKKKSEINAEIQKMIDDNPGTELGPEARAMLQMYADHKVEMDVVSMPIRLKASMLRDVTLARVQFSDDPEFRHMTKLGNPDVIRVAIALGLEELEKRRNDRQGQQKRKKLPGVPFSALVGPVDGNDSSSGEK